MFDDVIYWPASGTLELLNGQSLKNTLFTVDEISRIRIVIARIILVYCKLNGYERYKACNEKDYFYKVIYEDIPDSMFSSIRVLDPIPYTEKEDLFDFITYNENG